MWVINRVLSRAFDIPLYPFRGLNPWVGMAVIAAITAVIFLYIYKYTSNQTQIKKYKEKIKGHFLEVRLYKDIPRLIFKAEWNAMKSNFLYLRYVLVPLVIMIPIFIIFLIQLWPYYNYNQFDSGETTLVKVKLSENAAPEELNLKLAVPAGLSIDSPPLRMGKEKEVDWRIRVEKKGTYDLTFTKPDGATFTKVLKAGDRIERVSQKRPGPGIMDQISYPNEAPYPSSLNVASVELAYDNTPGHFYAMGKFWLIPYLLLAIIFAFALKGLLRVEI
jgi:hypothetical protein